MVCFSHRGDGLEISKLWAAELSYFGDGLMLVLKSVPFGRGETCIRLIKVTFGRAENFVFTVYGEIAKYIPV